MSSVSTETKKRGRKEYKFTDEERQFVLLCISGGIKHEAICWALARARGQDKPLNSRTFNKHFKNEIMLGKESTDARVINSLFKAAIGGSVRAQIFWLTSRRPEDWSLQYRLKNETPERSDDEYNITFEMPALKGGDDNLLGE